MQEGNIAPDFSAKDQNNNVVSLSDFKGKKVALYFYPKDNTTTCTVQACNLRDNFTKLKDLGIVVLGISVDNEKSHKKFETKFSLPFTLLADTDKKIVSEYGLWAQKKLWGREYMGTLRTTFLINEAGKIEHIIEKVDSKNHAEQILKVWGIKG